MKGKWQATLAAVLTVASVVVSPVLAAPPSGSRDLAQIRTQLVFEYVRFGNLKSALESAEQAVRADDTFVPGLLAKAYVHALLSQDAEAVRIYQRALQLEPDNPEGNNNYGLYLCEHGRPQEALQYFARALANPLYNAPQTAHLNMGTCYIKLGRAEEANSALLAALQAAPNYPPALRALARLHSTQDNPKLAAFYFERLVQALPEGLGADDLLLGVNIARRTGDAARLADWANQLKTRYPDSRETQQLISGN
ncbi:MULTISPECIES: type IV pilus biogenesis/stability protein PilW [Gulbenkiania]|uniref:Type IV pilus biogenesis/stability protein PilW n=2 Tax=Gulbenkiania TaxID=397456 RepID=A0A0K6H3R1_9NEIS|nr:MULTISPECIES: type IV pilus biogenesis/stability protein PilW [Gulbenkiania]TCW30303.1 type IV pilus assembly protein PilF [Gulbenkiania mobilis]CUA85612.1 type IV pilus biogenesis/stability protein PilW [Gulbenkiania indica]